jgi:hypothetical protein
MINHRRAVIRLVLLRFHTLNQPDTTFPILLFQHTVQKSNTGPGHNAFDDLL